MLFIIPEDKLESPSDLNLTMFCKYGMGWCNLSNKLQVLYKQKFKENPEKDESSIIKSCIVSLNLTYKENDENYWKIQSRHRFFFVDHLFSPDIEKIQPRAI